LSNINLISSGAGASTQKDGILRFTQDDNMLPTEKIGHFLPTSSSPTALLHYI